MIENKKFTYSTVKNQFGEEETLVVADEKEGEYEYDGKKQTYKYYGFEQRFYKDVPALDVAYSYLSKSVYSFVDMHSFTSMITLPRSKEFTETLKERGYDGVIQSTDGDEVVAFYPEQIKSIDNKAPTTNPDIRYSLKVDTEKLGEYEKKAADFFGTTDDFVVAGYMLPDGSMLDFSGAHWLDGASKKEIADFRRDNHFRQVEHDDIAEVMDYPGEAFAKFIDRGNIRLMPEAPGFTLPKDVEPTPKQYQRLKEFIREIKNNPEFDGDEVRIDIGYKSPQYLFYSGKINEDRVINDIKEYYKTGKVPEQSEYLRYRYSKTISERSAELIKENKHLKEAVEILKKEFELTDGKTPDESKIRTAAGRILKKYSSKFDKDTLVQNITQVYKYLRQDGADFDEAI